MNPDNLMKWIQKMEEIKNKARTAAHITLDDDEFITDPSVNLDSSRTRTSSI